MALATVLALPPVTAQTPPVEGVLARVVELTPGLDTDVIYNERTYRGPLRVVSGDGLGLVETMSPEDYLLGLREVPFAWPDEALRTQVVAARTYLAFTLAQGRTANGRVFGYDICATSACQVYAGLAGIDSADGGRWQAAVQSTAGEILLHAGAPAQALYSSTSGGRTRESEDIFATVDEPYLVAVDSPDEESPFTTWSFDVTEVQMQALLEHAGLVDGPLQDLRVEVTADGSGPWMAEIESAGVTERIPTYQLRGLINRAAAALMPDVLPAERGGGRRYPQTLLSGSYLIRTRLDIRASDGAGGRVVEKAYVFFGWGWGHQVGMSQYGAKAMADAGATYSEILGHYYGGLQPAQADSLLPDQVSVGLAVGVDEITLSPDGPVDVTIDGVPLGGPTLGSWRFQSEGNFLRVTPPVGLGLPPAIEQTQIEPGPTGDVLLFTLTAPAEVTVSVHVRGGVLARREFGGVDAGFYRFALSEIVSRPFDAGRPFRVVIEAVNPEGIARRVLIVVPDIR